MLMSVSAYAWETVEYGIACRSKQNMELVWKSVQQNDDKPLSAFMDRRECYIMKGGVKVTLIETVGNMYHFAYGSLKLWSYKVALQP